MTVLFGLTEISCLGGIGLFILFFMSIRIVRPVEKGLVENLGKFNRISEPGLLVLIPFIEKLYTVPTTEIRVDVAKQTVITKDNLNTDVDAIVYYRIQDVSKAIYNIDNYSTAIPSLAQTTLRAVIGKLTLSEANENRQKINVELEAQLDEETKDWGIDVIRVEIQSIQPPHDVQQAMNNVVKAENEKIAAVNFATAVETKADGEKRGAIKMAEGNARAIELEAQAKARAIELKADAEAKAIQLINESAQKYFKGEAQLLKRLQVTETALQNNTKYMIPEGSDISLVVSESAGLVLPVDKKR